MSGVDKYYERLKGKHQTKEGPGGGNASAVRDTPGRLPEGEGTSAFPPESYQKLGPLDYLCPVCNEKRSIERTPELVEAVKEHYQDPGYSGNSFSCFDPHEGPVTGRVDLHHQVEVAVSQYLRVKWAREFESSMYLGVLDPYSSSKVWSNPA